MSDTAAIVSNSTMDTDNIDTPAKVMFLTMKEKLREAFNSGVLRIGADGGFINTETETKESGGGKSSNTKIYSQESHAKRLLVCDPENWGVGKLEQMTNKEERAKFARFRKAHKTDGNNWTKHFTVQERTKPITNTKYKALIRLEKDKVKDSPTYDIKIPKRMVAPILEIFDIIHDCHQSAGHGGETATWTAVSKQYWNITQDLVISYAKLCPVCNEQQPKIQAQKGAIKPIISHEFRDRFQVDLIDMRTRRKKNINGLMMRWIMTVKDHSTGLTYLAALPFKQPSLVAHELDILFGLIGYPTIFHTDNGTEFISRQIVDLLKEINPNIQTVTGRPRKPSDQGSVENMNKHVKNVLKRIETEIRQSGGKPNWTSLLGRVMAALNKSHGRAKYDVSAYKAVFGMEYDPPIGCTVKDMRECSTIDERIKLVPDARLEEVARGMGELESGEGDDVGDGKNCDVARMLSYNENHWEWEMDGADANDPDIIDDDDMPAKQAESNFSEKQADTNDSGIIDDDDMSAEQAKSTSSEKQAPKLSAQADKHITLASASDDSVLKIDGKGDGSCDSKNKQELEGNFGVGIVRRKFRLKYSAKEAWEKDNVVKLDCRGLTLRRSRLYGFVYATIECDTCCLSGSHVIPMGDDDYLSDNAATKRWWDFDFMLGFAALLAHEAHLESYKNPDIFTSAKAQLVHCLHPKAIPEPESCHALQDHIEMVVSLLHNVNHYCALEGELYNKTIRIYDGLCYSLDNWEMHAVNVLKCSKLVDRLAIPNFERKLTGPAFDQCIRVKIGGEEWTIKRGYFQKQVDKYNCGPIACFKLMALFRCLEFRMLSDIDRKDTKSYRHHVISAYRRLVEKYNSELNVTVPVDCYDLSNIDDSDESVAEDACSDDEVDCFCLHHSKKMASMSMSCCGHTLHKSCMDHWLKSHSTCVFCREDVTPADIPIINLINTPPCKQAPLPAEDYNEQTPVRRAHQEQSEARRMKRKRQEQQAHSMRKRHDDSVKASGVGVGAIVTVKNDYRDISHPLGTMGVVYECKDSGGVKVVNSHGIICHGKKKNAYWLPQDRYVVRFAPDQKGVLTDDMDAIRAQVLGGTFEEGKYKMVSLQEAHKANVGDTPKGKTKGCGCRGGKCGRNCGCRRTKKVACDSSCTCNGNCDSPFNDNGNAEENKASEE